MVRLSLSPICWLLGGSLACSYSADDVILCFLLLLQFLQTLPESALFNPSDTWNLYKYLFEILCFLTFKNVVLYKRRTVPLLVRLVN
jgi:hypothetical protein